MRRLNNGRSLLDLYLLVVIFFLFAGTNAQAQALSGFTSSANRVFCQGASAIGGFFSQDLPGALDSTMPLLFPPYFGGEVHVRPYSFGLISGQLVQCSGITYVDLTKDPSGDPPGIGLSKTGSYIENMVRLQFSRLSLRAYYNLDTRRIPASSGYVDWMDWRLGADFDVINSFGVRLGATCDYYPQSPSLSYHIYDKNIPLTRISGGEPLTCGIVAAYNPFNSWIVSPTFEFRYEWPCNTDPSWITQWEYAIGLKLPKTVIGSSGLRFGQRHTEMVFGDNCHMVTLVTAGYFGDFVWFY